MDGLNMLLMIDEFRNLPTRAQRDDLAPQQMVSIDKNITSLPQTPF
jgi:hypothetical protein